MQLVYLTERFYTYDKDMSESVNLDNSNDTQNKNRLVLGHLNTISLAGKIDERKVLIGKHIDILVLAETKIDSSFPNDQFRIDRFLVAFRLDCNRFGGGVLTYGNENISCKQLNKQNLSDNTEGNFVEINLRK